MSAQDKPRWVYRFDNFCRALELLKEAIRTSEERALTPLELEGVIQRFEYTWELAWKTLKDFLEAQGVVLETITPAATIKAAYAARILDGGELWMQALDTRNKMSHTYDHQAFEAAVTKVKDVYLALFVQMQSRLDQAGGRSD